MVTDILNKIFAEIEIKDEETLKTNFDSLFIRYGIWSTNDNGNKQIKEQELWFKGSNKDFRIIVIMIFVSKKVYIRFIGTPLYHTKIIHLTASL